ncbi:MAG: hypothetical protein AAGI66_01160 [Cyanobacteria bacterium P01_H01_bin.74]
MKNDFDDNTAADEYWNAVHQVLERIEKLCERPANPSLAYQNLRTIRDLTKMLQGVFGKKINP